MTTEALELMPGIDLVSTSLENRASFADGSLIRFFQGDKDTRPYLQKRGGWARLTSQTLLGTARGMHAFFDLVGNGYIGVGTEQVLELFIGGILDEITPVSSVSNITQPFSTIAGSPVVTVTDPARAINVGDWVYIATTTFIGGILLQGLYQVATVPAPGQYTITAAQPATATVANGGTVFNLTTQAGSDTVTFTLGGAVFTQGQQILVYLPTTVGGTTFSGFFDVAVNAGVFSFTAPSPAAANANGQENGGQVQIIYPLAAQLDGNSAFVYGAGPYGQGAFGQGSGQVGTFVPRQWSLDNFGQILLASPFNGALYQWNPPTAYNNRATIVAAAPKFSTDMFVAMPQEQVVSLGSDGGGFQDPMLVRFSDVGDFVSDTSWTALATNQAGSFRLTKGALIVGGLQGDLQGYIWTDEGLWTMNYIQPPFVYSFIEVGHGCGLIAKRAAALIAGQLCWLGHRGFWKLEGEGVAPLPCSVWDFLFDNLDPQWIANVHAWPNSDFNEVAWHFPALGSNGLPTLYVSYNLSSGKWDKGILTATAAIDRSAIAAPVRADGPNGLLQQHEIATDADGQPMASFAETHWFTWGGGGGADFIYLDRLLPDFIYNDGGSVAISVIVKNYPGAKVPQRTFGPFTASEATEFIVAQCRGRLMKLRFDFSALGSFARLGSIRAVVAPAGGM